MTNSDAPAGASLGSTLGALVATFILVVPVSALLLGFNWTQAVLIGGFASVVAGPSPAASGAERHAVAVVSAVATSRRSMRRTPMATTTEEGSRRWIGLR